MPAKRLKPSAESVKSVRLRSTPGERSMLGWKPTNLNA